MARTRQLQQQRVYGNKIIACVGDSITRGDAAHEPGNGTHLPLKTERKMQGRGNYPLLLRWLLASASVTNFGHGGCTAVNGTFGYVRTEEYKAALKSKPSVVILMLGTNDAKHKLWPQHKSSFVAALRSMGRSFLDLPSQPSLILMTPPPIIYWPSERTSFSAKALATEVVRSIRLVAEQLGHSRSLNRGRDACAAGRVTMLDLHALWEARDGCRAAGCNPGPSCKQHYIDDGVHTSAVGAAAIAQAAYEVLQTCSGRW